MEDKECVSIQLNTKYGWIFSSSNAHYMHCMKILVMEKDHRKNRLCVQNSHYIYILGTGAA